MSDSIICPKCKTEIPLSQAISHQAEERLRAEFEVETERLLDEQAQQLAAKDAEVEAAIEKAEAEATAAAEARAVEQVEAKLRDLEEQVIEQDTRRREAEQ